MPLDSFKVKTEMSSSMDHFESQLLISFFARSNHFQSLKFRLRGCEVSSTTTAISAYALMQSNYSDVATTNGQCIDCNYEVHIMNHNRKCRPWI